MIFKLLLPVFVLLQVSNGSFGFTPFFSDSGPINSVHSVPNIEFPKDHNAHLDFKTEWWYVTANLVSENGEVFGVQWTLFRSSLEQSEMKNENLITNNMSWDNKQIWMAHAAITTKNNHYYSEKFARGGTGQAGVKINEFSAWIDNWYFSGTDDWEKVRLHAKTSDFEYSLGLKSKGPIILNGTEGLSIKTEAGHSSIYYSQPFFEVHGEIIVQDKVYKVTGQGWADREWSNAILGSDQQGWDWASVHLDSGEKIMVFQVRGSDDAQFYSGTLVKPNKEIKTLEKEDLFMTPLFTENIRRPKNGDSVQIPTRWRISIPAEGISIIANAVNSKSYLDTLIPYWEGPITITGSHSGVGYLEMTGY